jgi:hypothetical protein
MATAHVFNLIFNCTSTQFGTATGTTLPAAGFSVIQAPNPAQGTIISRTVTFTGNVTTGTMTIGSPSANSGLLARGMPITDTTNPSYIPAGTTITSLSPLTMSANGAGVGVGDTLVATGGTLQVDFSYDGAYFLRFFGANPVGSGYDTNPGVVSNQMTPGLVSALTSIFAATLGAPVPSNQAVPPNFENSGPY